MTFKCIVPLHEEQPHVTDNAEIRCCHRKIKDCDQTEDGYRASHLTIGLEQERRSRSSRTEFSFLNRATLPFLSAFCVIILFVWIPRCAAPARAQETPFYQGKRIQIIIGSTGGLYERWAHLLARAMSKNIPGQPSIVVRMRQGSGIRATHYAYGVAAPDGLTLVMFHRHVYMQQLIERKEVKFDLRRFNWIGSPDKSLPLLYIRADSPYKSVDDVLRSSERPICGASTMSALTYSMNQVLQVALGATLKVVIGFSGRRDIDEWIERGELVCRVSDLAGHFGREPYDTWHKKGFDRHLLLFGRKRDPRVSNVPTIYELMEQKSTPELNRQVAEAILAGNQLGRPMVAPPGTPHEAVKILREAYIKVFSDPDFLAEVKRSRIYLDPSSGIELEDLVRQVMGQPPEVIARLKPLFSG